MPSLILNDFRLKTQIIKKSIKNSYIQFNQMNLLAMNLPVLFEFYISKDELVYLNNKAMTIQILIVS